MDNENAKADLNAEYVTEIMRAIAQTGKLANRDWVELSVVFTLDEQGDLVGCYAYTYNDTGKPNPTTFMSPQLMKVIKKYRDSLLSDHAGGVRKILLQYNCKNQKFNQTFEYDDLSKWQITPQNIDTMPNRLRPNL